MSEEHHSRIAELERRIHEMERHAEEAFGEFTALDWWLCILAGLALPILLLLLYWP